MTFRIIDVYLLDANYRINCAKPIRTLYRCTRHTEVGDAKAKFLAVKGAPMERWSSHGAMRYEDHSWCSDLSNIYVYLRDVAWYLLYEGPFPSWKWRYSPRVRAEVGHYLKAIESRKYGLNWFRFSPLGKGIWYSSPFSKSVMGRNHDCFGHGPLSGWHGDIDERSVEFGWYFCQFIIMFIYE